VRRRRVRSFEVVAPSAADQAPDLCCSMLTVPAEARGISHLSLSACPYLLFAGLQYEEGLDNPSDRSCVGHSVALIYQDEMSTDHDGEALIEDRVVASRGTDCWDDWSVETPKEAASVVCQRLIGWATCSAKRTGPVSR
jgi:hypothetical protein